ncbi:MAG: hypothetical protein N838_23285 [Thiohalocapsa sp. PB-PSB1]|jgi:hypothetical protein|nr:MAG: hypothetical protein N838_26560 [Thiohalocapsa sp. PB-PSB1]QQO55831.1 MAG: hypothetical protein N838_23285 [Thiohalocapsa sp. PB-PSB1]HCS89172.1 hypothetical protein [Chromatiaceae bacterium]
MPRLLLLTAIALIVASLLMLLWRRLLQGVRRQQADAARPSSASAWLLFLLPLPVAVAAVVSLAQGQLLALLGNSIGYGLFLGGALLVRRGGLSAGKASVAAWPMKTLGAVLVALATGMTAWLGVGHHPAIAVVFALLALLGCYLTYGFELKHGRHFPGIGKQGIGKQARLTLSHAEHSIAAIEQASRDIEQPELADQLRRIAELASAILNRLQEDPRGLRRARKFLNVYLDGVKSIVEGYAKTHGLVIAPELDERFRRALITVEDAFREQQQRLLDSDLDDLDVQIEVLTQQLEREGIV